MTIANQAQHQEPKMHFDTFQQMLDSLKPTQSALDFWREVDRWQAAVGVGV